MRALALVALAFGPRRSHLHFRSEHDSPAHPDAWPGREEPRPSSPEHAGSCRPPAGSRRCHRYDLSSERPSVGHVRPGNNSSWLISTEANCELRSQFVQPIDTGKVEMVSGLVQQQNRRILDQRLGNRQAFSPSAPREPQPPVRNSQTRSAPAFPIPRRATPTRARRRFSAARLSTALGPWSREEARSPAGHKPDESPCAAE